LAQLYITQLSRGRLFDLTSAVRGFDERILRVELSDRGAKPTLDVEFADGSRLPISALGHGPILLMRLLLAAVSVSPDGILLIDEIERAFHWSALPHVWRTVHDAAALLNVQVFATTYSRECVAAAAGAVPADEDWLRLFQLGRRDDSGAPGVHAFNLQDLRTGREPGLDLR
jgi:predicted ATPase